MVEFTDSNYKFTDPIRYFKANDPIYFEVENIPLKQLQENNLWLKDQIKNLNIQGTNTTNGTSLAGEIDRNYFSELKPYVSGNDNIVRVKPGRFTARINDARNITPLQIIERLSGSYSGINQYNTWTARALNDTLISDIISKFRQTALTDGLGMNGLAERAFSYPAKSPNLTSQILPASVPVLDSVGQTGSVDQPPYPIIEAQLWANFTDGTDNSTKFILKQYDSENTVLGFASLGGVESEFIKRWRGVARTAVVDVPNEITIEVPRFDINDFYYIDESGQARILENASQRIDLLFVYSKPVDMSGTTIAKYSNTDPTLITEPKLGLVHGAGIGLDFQTHNRAFRNIEGATVLNNGKIKMLPFIGDQVLPNSGFVVSGLTVKGSFPSPDDLMNLTPILDEELTSEHYGLIGQSILPLAYIVVKKNALSNNNNVNIINSNDVIDIRPFFRTTELSYNERAGIAAAVPAPSLANPIVTQAELGYEVNRVYTDLDNRIKSLELTSTSNTGGGGGGGARAIAFGYVLGGLKYGVEGVLATSIVNKGTQGSLPVIASSVKTTFNYPNEITLNEQPDWDIAQWGVQQGSPPDALGSKVNDRINIYQFLNFSTYRRLTAAQRKARYNYGLFPNKYATSRKSSSQWGSAGWDDPISYLAHDANDNQSVRVHFYFVRKKIYITLPPGIVDYDVQVKLLNCLTISTAHIPPTVTTQQGLFQLASHGSNSIWVEKGKDSTGKYFVINVAWPAKGIGSVDNSSGNNYSFEGPLVDPNLYSQNGFGNTDPGYTLNEVAANGGAINNIANIGARFGLNPLGFRDCGELTAGWLVSSPELINLSYTNSVDRGGVNMGLCNYPSVTYTVQGYQSNYIANNVTTNNGPLVITGR